MAQSKSDGHKTTLIKQDVINWVEKFFIDNGYYLNQDSSKKIKPKDIKGTYFIFYIEKQTINDTSMVVFIFGKSEEPGKNFVLVQKQRGKLGSKTKASYEIFGVGKYDYELKRMYSFFESHSIFSTKAKSRCYRNLQESEQNIAE